MRVTVGNLKGGAGKTTTAVYAALRLGRDGSRVLLVDADPGQNSALAWSEVAGEEWPASVTVIPWAVRDLARRVEAVAGDYRHLVIDVGPKNAGMLREALRVSDEFVVPAAPRPIDLHDLGATLAIGEEYPDVRTVVLLTQVRARSRLGVEARAILTEQGVPLMAAEVALLDAYVLAYGTAPDDLGHYDQVLDELVNGGARG